MTSKTETRNDKLRAAHDKLQDAVAEIVSGDEWKRMLKVASKFHRYSFNNHLMIFLQRPDATVVAGFNRWRSLGRFVKKGEKGIAIFAPCKYKVSPSLDGPAAASSDGKDKSKNLSGSAAKVAASEGRPTADGFEIRGFRVVHVFDISQTEGEELPDLDAVRPKLLDADVPEGIWDALVSQAHAAGFEVMRNQRGSENGYCDFSSKQIAVRPDVAPAQAVKTLIHELGHALLHSEEVPRSKEVAEVEVESVAYIVCDAIGLDSGGYSFAYVCRWAEGSAELLKETGERVMACANEILVKLEAGHGGRSGYSD
jgi:N-terminal domain of anti-restriction factor ArdC/IrrE N-terminal-like domain